MFFLFIANFLAVLVHIFELVEQALRLIIDKVTQNLERVLLLDLLFLIEFSDLCDSYSDLLLLVDLVCKPFLRIRDL